MTKMEILDRMLGLAAMNDGHCKLMSKNLVHDKEKKKKNKIQEKDIEKRFKPFESVTHL